MHEKILLSGLVSWVGNVLERALGLKALGTCWREHLGCRPWDCVGESKWLDSVGKGWKEDLG